MIARKNVLVVIDSTPDSEDPLLLALRQPVRLVRGTPLPTGLVAGQEPVHLVASGGTGGYVYDITEDSHSGLPPGLSFNSTTGYITGTPTAVGHYSFHAEVQDSSATVAVGEFTLEVFGRLSSPSRALLSGEVNAAYNFRFTVLGAIGAVTWALTSGSLPAGLTLDSDGLLHGTPSGPDGFNYFTLTATDAGSGDTLDIAYRIQIYAELSISPQTLNFTVGIYGEFQIQTTGGKAPISFLNDSTGPFTNGLSMSPTGLVSGIALAVNQQARNIKCSDSLGGSDSAFIILKAKQTNSILQPQKNTVDVGPEGPSKINLVEGANVTIAATNNGTTATYEISATAAPGGGVDTVNGVGPDSSGNVEVPFGGVETVNGIGPDSSGNVDIGEIFFRRDDLTAVGGESGIQLDQSPLSGSLAIVRTRSGVSYELTTSDFSLAGTTVLLSIGVNAADIWIIRYASNVTPSASSFTSAVTWNPSDKSAKVTLSGGDLIYNHSGANGNDAVCRATVGKSSGKWYWEVKLNNHGIGSSAACAAIAAATESLSNYIGSGPDGYSYLDVNGFYYNNGAGAAFGATYTNNDILMVALDMDNGKVWFGKNGIWQQASGFTPDPASGTFPAFTGLTLAMFPACGSFDNGAQMTGMFAPASWTYAAPAGFSALTP